MTESSRCSSVAPRGASSAVGDSPHDIDPRDAQYFLRSLSPSVSDGM